MMRPKNSSLARQRFKSQENYELPTLSTHSCKASRKRFVYWHDIQVAFEPIFYLLDRSEERLLFMIDEKAELQRPLRIEYSPDEDYTVIYIEGQGIQSDNYRHQDDSVASPPINSFAPLEPLIETTLYLFDRLKLVPNAARATFLQLVANARYYHGLLEEEIAKLDESGSKSEIDEIDCAQVLKQLQELEEQVPDWDYRNVCFNMFYGVQTKWDYATSKLFIVLPSDLNSWEDERPSTHKFRLYFLCDNSMDIVAQSGLPQHVHFSNHPGYDLLRQQEFFEKYGDYTLRVLRMVKNGYSNNACEIPSISTLRILWKYTHFSNTLTKRTLRHLVDKAIAHLEQISPPKWIMEPGLSRNQSAGIKAYLHIQEGDNAEGNLQRHIDSHQCVSWRCQAHKEQHFDRQHLTGLRGYVSGKMGHVDMQQAMLQVALQSYFDSDKLQRHLAGITQSFNLSINLNWNTTRAEVEKLCRTITHRKTVALEIDGVSVNVYPRGYVPYTRNIFAENIVSDTDTGLQLITVLNYPVPEEQCIHIGNFSLQSRLSPLRLTRSWVELRADLDRFGKLVSNAQAMSECEEAVMELRSVQKKHGLPDNTLVTIHDRTWGAVFDLGDCAVVEAYSVDAACPKAVHSSGSLKKLTVDLQDLEFDKEFFQLVESSPDLHELNVSYRGRDVFYYFEHIVKAWRESSSRYCLTLIDRLEDTQGRIVARMTIQKCSSQRSESYRGVDQTDGTSPTAQENEMDARSTNINYLDWNLDQVSAQVFGRTATLLDMATQQHSSALKLFTLDVSQLRAEGILAVQNVLERSRLEHLNVVCNPFDPSLSQAVSRVLGAVNWETIKSLVLSGSHVNEWLDLCPSPETPQLLSLQICGTGLAPQELTHSSVLFIHQVAHESTLEELDFNGVRMQETSDWTVIMDAVDPAYLKSLGLCESSKTQLQSNKYATDLFNAKFNKTPIPMPRAFEDLVIERLNSVKSQRSRYSEIHSSTTASGITIDEPQTSSPRISEAQDIAARTPPATPPSAHDDEDAQDATALAPLTASQVAHDTVAHELPETPQSGYEVVILGPFFIPQGIQNMEAPAPVTLPARTEGLQEIMAQGQLAGPQAVQPIATHGPLAKLRGPQGAMTQGPPGRPHGLQNIAVKGETASTHRLRSARPQGPQGAAKQGSTAPRAAQGSVANELSKLSRWRRMFCCGF